MHSAKFGLTLGMALLCAACSGTQLSLPGGRTPGWSDQGWPMARSEGGVWLPGYSRDPFHRSTLVCDRFGRCWRRDGDERFARGEVEVERPAARPPGWAESLPDSARTDDRFVRPRSGLLCDRTTRICYKEGDIDKSDTKQVFGRTAAKRADQLRDEHGTARVFVPQRGVPCDRERQVCFADGAPNRALTRRYFGRDAARDLD